MPTVEITQEQYDRWKSGYSIVIEPQGTKIKNVFLVPLYKTSTWQHIYFCFEGSIRPGGRQIDLLDYIHLTGAYGEPALRSERHQSTTSSLPLGDGGYSFKIVDPNEN